MSQQAVRAAKFAPHRIGSSSACAIMVKILFLFALVTVLVRIDASPFTSIKMGVQKFVNKMTGLNKQKRTDGELKSGIAKLYDDVSFIAFIFSNSFLISVVSIQPLTVNWHMA